jgi:hypothetical protein
MEPVSELMVQVIAGAVAAIVGVVAQTHLFPSATATEATAQTRSGARPRLDASRTVILIGFWYALAGFLTAAFGVFVSVIPSYADQRVLWAAQNGIWLVAWTVILYLGARFVARLPQPLPA